MAVCQSLVPLVNIKIAGKWMFIPLKMVLIGIDPYPYIDTFVEHLQPQLDLCTLDARRTADCQSCMMSQSAVFIDKLTAKT